MYKTFKIILLIFVGFFYLHPLAISSENKIKIGLLVPITGDDKELGEQIIKTRILKNLYIFHDTILFYLKLWLENLSHIIKKLKKVYI